jgi:hypothetical protein
MTKVFVSVILFSTIIFPGCNTLQDENDPENPRTGTVIIKLTDAPFPADLVAEANITIDRITLRKKFVDDFDAENEEENGEKESKNSPLTYEMEEPAAYNLLELSNGTTALLAEMEIPSGIYPEIRLHVTDAGILLKDGNAFNLKVPGGEESGLKIILNPSLEMEEGAFVEVLLDFDVSRSFVMRGNMKHGAGKVNGFIFKPVVRAVAQVQSATGEISGKVTDEEKNPVENAIISLISGEDTITSALTSEDGIYALIGILPGSYLLSCDKKGYEEESIEIEVEKRKLTEQNFVLKKSD